MGITQTKLAEMLGLCNARVSEIMNGKSEPSLKIGRELSRQLNIDPAVVLGGVKSGQWNCSHDSCRYLIAFYRNKKGRVAPPWMFSQRNNPYCE